MEDDYAELTVEAAEDNDITLYDGAYVALALKLHAMLFTADDRLLKKLRDMRGTLSAYPK